MSLNILFITFISMFLASCQSSSVRNPSSEPSSFDPQKVSLLKWAAKNKILVQIDDASFHHINSSSIDSTCEKFVAPAWSEIILTSLENLKKISGSKINIHILDVKLGSEPTATISQDLDGLTYLTLQYAEKTKTTVVSSPSEIPCDKNDSHYIGKNLNQKFYVTPSSSQIRAAVSKISQSKTPDRWAFKPEFLILLAENMTLFRVTPDVSFEKAFDGQSLLTHFLNQQAQKISNSKTEALHYWLSEINQRSHSGSYLNLFTLKSDKNLATGIVTHQNSHGVAYPYMSYKIEDGQFLISDLSKLENCLSELKMRYRRSLASVGSELSTQPNNFLSPGINCQESN